MIGICNKEEQEKKIKIIKRKLLNIITNVLQFK